MIKQTYKPIEPVNIGVNKDTINDFARKYNLEIERVYDILNKYKQRKVAFTAKGDYWNVTETGATLSVAHNGNIIYAVYSVADGVETQVVVGVKRDDTNVILEAEAPFDGYMLFLSDDSTRGVGDNLPDVLSGATTDRPVNTVVGLCYFDTTLNKPIWCKGGNVWVDATGATV